MTAAACQALQDRTVNTILMTAQDTTVKMEASVWME